MIRILHTFLRIRLEDFRIRTRLSLEGIGATLRSEDGYTIVAKLVKGGAAFKGGKLKKNDKIIEVAQAKGDPVDVVDMDLQDVVKEDQRTKRHGGQINCVTRR